VTEMISRAVGEYANDVRAGTFPTQAESYHLSAVMREQILAPRP
jgi:ketopantoate hydroxymethyltransferase